MSQPGRPSVTIITGMSGSGKSVVLNALEDAGHFCVDNLPSELVHAFVDLQAAHDANQVAIAVDARTAASLPQLAGQLERLRADGYLVRLLFLDATVDTLVRRYSETRRRHPLSGRLPTATPDGLDAQAKPEALHRALVEAIEYERELLAGLREQALVIDTSVMRSASLQAQVKALLSVPAGQLTLVFESFAFKRGLPLDADFVFDVRMLPNPFYEGDLRDLTGRDEPVADFLRGHPAVSEMVDQIGSFIERWLAPMARDHRSYVTVAVGCTGGQHRSVFTVEELSRRFSERWITLKRHRELE